MKLLKEESFDAVFFDGSEVTFTPFINRGRVGYKMEVDGETTFVTLNPSSSGDSPDIFVYVGETGDPEHDFPVVFIPPFNRKDHE